MRCPFCRIASKEAPATLVYEDDRVLAFRDLRPQSPVHVLAIPREHITSLAEATEEHASLLGHILLVAALVARQEAIDTSGYRIVFNTGPDAGQSVSHLHLHLLGGLPLG